ncbi:hypothetical protein BBO99_00004031 [Phytophthora kernoviae]|uniref:GB1/RHD3-type G domain-containing protein n=2 Tax=Phytophthora kernoviae TaxID=325452 RepID=A0A3R7JVM1_9STRA|nr:hypothetical protein G195_004568 [Phytophthora kernoviae 00238/432]KAG2523682.1 hypothetical protein JM16_005263 [Phytophthora kernoviae]KAG2528261.1 hypothetical protein JM18_003323 [Phytophthora kernoviae]RLN21506.1 hypothetical protein BBI17_004143 [Phytophthora kernoviae]RLN81061.1 hypothetical protein BBO99_00004031 [Phytophthora kernoviae]
MGSSSAPVCLIQGGADGLHVTDEGIRTGKSFFLNQLASHRDDLPWSQDGTAVPNGTFSNGISGEKGFRVGPTTQSCTRGIWLWAPQPPVRNPSGQLVLFLDTEGMAATDNDESYDAKIFSLGLLLSSLFVFNTMGVIDEGAIDRLYLVSELTKHVCVSAHSSAALSTTGASTEESALSGDKLEESRALAPHFPPFVWLLRDFLLDMQMDGTDLTANEYLEKALDAREISATALENTRTRQEERNRTRASIRVLFGKRECFTLVRPVTDERGLRRAAELADSELRSEFVEQMATVRHRLLSSVPAKQLLGKVLDGPQMAQLVRCYTDTMNSGAIPDIKAAPLAAGAWDAAASKDEAFQATMDVLEEVYEREARGPAKKKAFYQFLRIDSSTKQELMKQVETVRTVHLTEKEDWIRRAADQAAEKTMLQKQFKQSELDIQQKQRDMNLLDKERQQLQQLNDAEVKARSRLEKEYDTLRNDNDELQLKKSD